MTYVDIWRNHLRQDLREFTLLVKEDRSIDLVVCITTAVLWGVRDANSDSAQLAALREVCNSETHLKHLLDAIKGWSQLGPLGAAQRLSALQENNLELRRAIASVLDYFADELFADSMSDPSIIVNGPIRGGNVLVGSYQIITGDLNINHISEERGRVCPTAPQPPHILQVASRKLNK